MGVKNQNQVFGIRAVMEAILAGKEFDRLFLHNKLSGELGIQLKELLKKRNIEYSRVPIEKLNRLTVKNHQGAVGFLSLISYVDIESVIQTAYESGADPLILILDRVTDVRNFGAISRTAEAAGVHGLVIPKYGSAQINPDAIKTSAGALHHLPVCKVDDLGETCIKLKETGLALIGCTEKANKSIYEINFHRPIAVVMGSEENGISEEILKQMDDNGKLPMNGQIDSLNVSVASGVVLFEALRQRGLGRL